MQMRETYFSLHTLKRLPSLRAALQRLRRQFNIDQPPPARCAVLRNIHCLRLRTWIQLHLQLPHQMINSPGSRTFNGSRVLLPPGPTLKPLHGLCAHRPCAPLPQHGTRCALLVTTQFHRLGEHTHVSYFSPAACELARPQRWMCGAWEAEPHTTRFEHVFDRKTLRIPPDSLNRTPALTSARLRYTHALPIGDNRDHAPSTPR